VELVKAFGRMSDICRSYPMPQAREREPETNGRWVLPGCDEVGEAVVVTIRSHDVVAVKVFLKGLAKVVAAAREQ
jgi:hypothetical protein